MYDGVTYYGQNEEEKKRGRIIGGVASLLYFILLGVMMWLITFHLEVQTEGEGLMINFGDMAEAAPGGDLQMNDETAEAQQAQQATSSKDLQEQLTQDFEEAPEATTQKPKNKPKPSEQQNANKPRPTQAPAEKPREVDRRALFPGRTAGSTATSDGTGQGKGNQGDLSGSPEGSYDGTGTGNSGGSASLAGRSLAGSLPKPDYGVKEEGRVVIEINVDQNGNVISAAYRSVGSTTQNSTLVAAALRAARQARFNVDNNAAPSQRGTITYNFRMQ